MSGSRRRLGVLMTVAGAVLAAVPGLAPAAGQELPVPEHDAERANDLADEILRRPELRLDRNLVERAREWVFDQLGRLVDELFRSGGATTLGWVVVVLAVLVAVVLGVRLSRSVQRDPGAAVARPVVPRRSATDWRVEADAHEAAGEWRAALRCRYRALVADLAERGLVEEVPGRTAGEYRQEMAVAAPVVAGDFASATDLFERAWYGNAATGPDEAGRLRDLARRVVTGVRR